MPPCALIWIWVTVTSGRHPMPARGYLVFYHSFYFTLFIICLSLLASLSVACNGEDGPTPTPFTGEWEQFDDIDAITDEGYIGIRLDASEDDISSGYLDAVRIYVRCTNEMLFSSLNGDIDVFVVWNKDVGEYIINESPVVDWRVDNSDPEMEVWYPTIDSDNDTTFHPHPESAVNDLRKAERISIRVYSASIDSVNFQKIQGEDDKDAMTAVFHPVGFEDAYKPSEKACE